MVCVKSLCIVVFVEGYMTNLTILQWWGKILPCLYHGIKWNVSLTISVFPQDSRVLRLMLKSMAVGKVLLFMKPLHWTSPWRPFIARSTSVYPEYSTGQRLIFSVIVWTPQYTLISLSPWKTKERKVCKSKGKLQNICWGNCTSSFCTSSLTGKSAVVVRITVESIELR